MINFLSPDELRALVTYVQDHRESDAPCDVVAVGHTAGDDAARDANHVQAYRDAGATWWLEDISPWTFGWQWEGDWPIEQMNARIRGGPPRD